MKGWESKAGVVGIPFIENKESLSIIEVPSIENEHDFQLFKIFNLNGNISNSCFLEDIDPYLRSACLPTSPNL